MITKVISGAALRVGEMAIPPIGGGVSATTGLVVKITEQEGEKTIIKILKMLEK